MAVKFGTASQVSLSLNWARTEFQMALSQAMTCGSFHRLRIAFKAAPR
jgi:hypothetical protein